MSKYVPDTTIDAMLAVITAGCTRLDICSTQPTSYAQATSTYSLGNKTLTGAWSTADGDVSGRKITCAQQTGISITSSGTAAHIAGTNGSNTLWFVTTLSSSQAVTSGNTATINSFDLEVADAA